MTITVCSRNGHSVRITSRAVTRARRLDRIAFLASVLEHAIMTPLGFSGLQHRNFDHCMGYAVVVARSRSELSNAKKQAARPIPF